MDNLVFCLLGSYFPFPHSLLSLHKKGSYLVVAREYLGMGVASPHSRPHGLRVWFPQA